MKRVIMTLATVLGLGMASYANGGGLFGQGQAVAEEHSTSVMTGTRLGGAPNLPGHGEEGNQPAPLGSGALLLIGMGAAYAAAKRRKE